MAVAWRQDYLFYRKYLFQFVTLYKNRQDIKMFLEILLSLGTIAVFGVFAIKPTVVTIANLSNEVKTKEDLVRQMDQKIQNISLAQEQFDFNKEKISVLDISIPEKPFVIEYIRQIEGMADSKSLQVEIVSVNDVVLIGTDTGEGTDTTSSGLQNELEKLALPENANELSIAFSVSGDYTNLRDFLKDIESHRRPGAIDSVSFDSNVTAQEEKIVLHIKTRLP